MAETSSPMAVGETSQEETAAGCNGRQSRADQGEM